MRLFVTCIDVLCIMLQVLQVSYFMYCTIFIDYADSGPGKTWRKLRIQNHKKIRDFAFISLIFPLTIVSICFI